ncbi:MAG: methyltransferase domain-containing protein [Pseudomonadota bacterium]
MANPDPSRPASACHVCGGLEFLDRPVLWPELIDTWELTPAEVRYVDEQQGSCCTRCGSNVRSIALARAILQYLGHAGPLSSLVGDPDVRAANLLEINDAGTLHPWLAQLRGHQLGSYPDLDMMAMTYPDAHFDLVVHSDTLEHVPDPEKALSEVLRILKPGGATIFTVPVIVGRLTRNRQGLPASYHGRPGCESADLRVVTEFGADFWASLLKAGFRSVELVGYRFPAGIATIARK